MPKVSSYKASLLEALKDPEEALEYLNAALEDSREAFLVALRNVSQAHSMSRVAKEAGIERESLYRSLSEAGNPTWDTMTGVLSALNLQFSVVPVDRSHTGAERPSTDREPLLRRAS